MGLECVKLALGEPALLGQHCMRERQRDGKGRRILQRNTETRYRPARNIDGQGQPRSPDRQPLLLLHEDDVYWRVVARDSCFNT